MYNEFGSKNEGEQKQEYEYTLGYLFNFCGPVDIYS